MHFESQKELFEYVRKYDADSIPTLIEILRDYNLRFIEIDELEKLIFNRDILIIDARSPKEYEETHIPGAVNFPVLANEERHNVGLVFKKYSEKAALKLAIEYAAPKPESLRQFLNLNDAKGKRIIAHCWRGGGRSKYLSKMIIDEGYDVVVLKNGIKSYRNNAVKYFSLNSFPYSLLEISGLTGCGKTEVIRKLSERFPVIDFEKSARHFSSLFGYIPYKIRNYSPVHNQTAFENNIYGETIYNRKFHPEETLYFAESESKKVGDFFIPTKLYSILENAKTIKIQCSFENRVNRIVKDYFDDDNRGLESMEEIFREKERLFKKEISGRKYEEALTALTRGDSRTFTEIMLNYYDSRYKKKPKEPIAEIPSDNITVCAEVIAKIYKRLTPSRA